ncbi:gastrula zinc finger protein XlCGF17.1-like [Syngnathoides biaculeatus]|uniref:gastrula zinc finger protein XlCGF17.1-like n=1 Tax=Syngnathoides biaculeatus TaxID=300417 RepID=UPI002ADDC0AC|nr:gastrula zinc finger protein XlCGF17.1-like [Syngnathoides biaculeatus]XP_061697767.1 gastrula zinc finger protein XlCGF17.1-like [Syngnathoides biaculeatus]
MQEKGSPEGQQQQCSDCGRGLSLPESEQTDKPDSASRCLSCRGDSGAPDEGAPQGGVHVDPHSCSLCGKTFISSAHLTLHLASHTKERRFQCGTCGKYFHQPSHLMAHEAIHRGDRPFKCPECGKTFGRAAHLKTHRRLHTGEKPFKCSYCDKAFTQKAGLLSHVRVHTDERAYRCDECGETFRSLPLLLSHKAEEAARQGKTPQAPAPPPDDLKCGVCCRTFIRSSYIRLHVRLEKGLRPYHCKVCNKTFAKLDSFVNHCDKHLRQKGGKSQGSLVKPPLFVPLSKPPPEVAQPVSTEVKSKEP